MRVCLFLLALATALSADPVKEHRAATKVLDKAARKYWREFKSRFSEADNQFRAPFSGKVKTEPDAVYDHMGFQTLFGEYRELMEAWAKADETLGASDAAGVHESLFKELLSVCKEIRKREGELKKTRPISRYMFDQRPAVMLDGLAIRLQGLVRAVAPWKELATAGWAKARKSDGKRSVQRRVAVIDALAIAGADLKPYAESDRMEFRIAAADSLADRKALTPLLHDKEPAVRRALLHAILEKGAKQPLWIGPVVERVGALEGHEQQLAVAILAKLTGQKFGHDAPAWKEWYDDYRKEIEGGSFDATKIEIQEVKPKPAADTTSFYGIPTASRRVLIIVHAGTILLCPAAWKDRRTKTEWVWRNTRKTWESRARQSHVGILRRELGVFRDSFSSKGRYGFATLQGDAETKTTEKLLDLSVKSERLVKKMVDRIPGFGWCSPLTGIQAATAIDEDIETVYLVNNGQLKGGTHCTPELALPAFQRWNRFRRIVVHSIRIDNQKEAGEALMKGFADLSGGTYLWFEKPKN